VRSYVPPNALTNAEKREILLRVSQVVSGGIKQNLELTQAQLEMDRHYQFKNGILPQTWKIMEKRKQDAEEDESIENFTADDDYSEYDTFSQMGQRNQKKTCCDGAMCIDLLIINHEGSLYLLWHETLDMLCIVSSFIYAHFAA
jgi:hypothetical protein